MPARPVVVAAAVLLAVVEVVIDWQTWIELNVSIVYGLPLMIAAAARNRRLLWGLALAFIGVTFVHYAYQIAPGAFAWREPHFLNRVLSAGTLLLTATLLHALIGALEALDARGREAEAASGRKTRLLTSMSHDLSTPLTTINVMADLIRKSAGNPALARELHEHAERLQRSAYSLSDLVTDALDVSQLDSGRVELRETEFALDEFLDEECRAFEPLAKAKGLYFERSTEGGRLRVRADRVKLARVLRNLVNNALKFTDRGGVTVSGSRASDGGALIRVADTGIGIAPQHLEQAFGEFAQINADDSRRTGWGLGLAICRRLMGLMGGGVRAESEEGRGSVFTVHLPAWRVVP